MGWQYRHGLVSYSEIGQLLNELGEQGWELVQILPAPQYMEVDRKTHYDKLQYYVKRPKAVAADEAKESPRTSAPVRRPARY